jgi:hypothetical protein
MPPRALPTPRHHVTRRTWLASLFLAGTIAHAQSPFEVPGGQPPPQRLELTRMNWQPECVGRVILNLPTDRPRSWSNEFDMAEVTRIPKPMSLADFWITVEKIKNQMAALPHSMVPTRLAHFEKTAPNAAFLIYYDNDASLWGPNLERFLHIDDAHVYQLKTPTLPIRNVKPSPELFKPYIEKYTPVLSRIHPRSEGVIPTGAGLCIDGAVVTGETGRNAKAGLNVEMAWGTYLGVGYLENNYKVSMSTGFESLERDQKRADFAMSLPAEPKGYKEFKVLRKQERLLSGLLGQEFITRTTLYNGHTYYRFKFLIKGGTESVSEPTISLHMVTPDSATSNDGKPYGAIPPEDDLIRTWDAVLRSFKVRPNALPDGQVIRAVN